MSSGAKKTAGCFHAKDDCAEVREKVFRLLGGWNIKVKVGIRRKQVLVNEVRLKEGRGTPWNADFVYDNMVKTLFKNSLHSADENIIVFARRGKSARGKMLAAAIERARTNFARATGIAAKAPTKINASTPSESCGLQTIDYFLWALQRLYERKEDRYFNFLSEHYRLIMDFDDKRTGKSYGRWYSDQDPLTKEKIMPVTG
jgi:hypothetical protein